MNALNSAALVDRPPRKPLWEREDDTAPAVAKIGTDDRDGNEDDRAAQDLEDLAMQMFDAIMAGRRR